VTTAERVPTVPGLTGLTVLARGGYATVYRAVQESLGREVAVKVENRTLESERDRRRFLREARAAGRMSSHPHVVDLFDAGVTADSRPYLIMELCRGNFADWMKETPLSAAEARDVGVKIADALSDAHSLGVLHRDVKPANILLSDFGEPVLADFGLAILTESRDLSITLDVLTPAYAPPEMFRHGPPAPTADVYSLCATLYALMAGRPPRWTAGGRDPSLVSLVDMFEEPIPDLPGVPASLLVLLRRGMSNVESERPTASELRDELLALELGALPPSELETLSASGASAPPAPTSRDSDGPATVTAPVAGLRSSLWRSTWHQSPRRPGSSSRRRPRWPVRWRQPGRRIASPRRNASTRLLSPAGWRRPARSHAPIRTCGRCSRSGSCRRPSLAPGRHRSSRTTRYAGSAMRPTRGTWTARPPGRSRCCRQARTRSAPATGRTGASPAARQRS
jgi:serine/threonine protein kinase